MLQNPDELVWVLSSRPSGDSFPNSGATTTKLYRVLERAGLLFCVHVTDFVKFRGPGPDAMADADIDKPITGAEGTTTLREVSLSCLEAEWAVAPPRTVLVAGNRAQGWIREQAALSASRGFSKFLKELAATTVPVISWMAWGVTTEDIATAWSRSIPRCGRLDTQ